MFQKTFEILIMVVIGGLGSISGAIMGASLYTVGLEFLRVLEEPMSIGPIYIPGIPGMRMVVLSLILIIIMLFWRRGIMGRNEITWDGIYKLITRLKNKISMRKEK
jgi:branched-chain amino acid transport system permease protein